MDEITKGRKRKKARIQYHVHLYDNEPTGAHAQAMGTAEAMRHDVEVPDDCKSVADRTDQSAFPEGDHSYPNPYSRQTENRSRVAAGHPDLIQHHTTFAEALHNLSTRRGNLQPGVPENTPGYCDEPGNVRLQVADFQGEAGGHRALRPDFSPEREAAHNAATGRMNTGTHHSDSQTAACTSPRPASKAAALELIKTEMRSKGYF